MSADSTHPPTTNRLVIGQSHGVPRMLLWKQENGRPPVPVEWLKKEWGSSGLLKRVQLTISGCLAPCDLPNVVTISNENGTQWFGEITEFEQYRDLVDWQLDPKDAVNCCRCQRNFSDTTCIRSGNKQDNEPKQLL